MKPNYKTHDPKGWGGDPKRGAALGRPTIIPEVPRTMTVRLPDPETPWLYFRKIHVNSGGYDPNGTYFGVGTPLYWCADADGEIDFVVRGSCREAAKAGARAILRAHGYEKVRFFR
jgi:hypothetical protein